MAAIKYSVNSEAYKEKYFSAQLSQIEGYRD